MNAKPVLLTGIKPTGNLHLGNYFGALKPTVDLVQNDSYHSLVMVADYHALNTVQNAQDMRHLTEELLMAYIACGLDPKKVTLFKQSDVPAHTELAWIFDTITTMPYLMRAHAFKAAVSKVHMENNPDMLSNDYFARNENVTTWDEEADRLYTGIGVGTFNYPMLMAADILLYDAAIVPVGQDQKQHIEYTRDTAEKFNRIYGETFSLPKESIMPDVAIVPGTDGQKMSKSYGNTIPLFSSYEELKKAVMGIVTDSSGSRPANVYAIHRLIKSEAELESLYSENTGNYKALKEALLADLEEVVAPMRKKYLELKKNPAKIRALLKKGGEKARKRAEKKMQEVRKAIGVI